MIFKRTATAPVHDPKYKEVADIYSFSVLNELIYPESIPALRNLQSKFNDGNRLYPDLIAALFRKMYESGLSERRTIRNAILACSYHLQNKGFQFLGFIRKDDELDRIGNEVDFVKSWDFDENKYKIKEGTSDKSSEPLNTIFSETDFSSSYNVFFVAGTQSFEMLDLRIKRAATLISSLKKHDFITSNNTKIILSGWNNAKISNSKVQFANESLAMRNLLIHKLLHYLEEDLTDDFIISKIEAEINSRDTRENIEELIKKLELLAGEVKEGGKQNLNLFIVSSTFHLLQLSDHIQGKEENMQTMFSKYNINHNLFLVGSENPNHFFKIFDASYIKLLINEVIHRNFQFCRT